MNEVPSGIELVMLVGDMLQSHLGDSELRAAILEAQQTYEEACADERAVNSTNNTQLSTSSQGAYVELRRLLAYPNAREIQNKIIEEARQR